MLIIQEPQEYNYERDEERRKRKRKEKGEEYKDGKAGRFVMNEW